MSEKPRLYHGSTNRNIETFEPRVSKGSGEEDGPVVFASPDRATSIMFLANVPTAWSTSYFGDVPVAIIPMDRDEFIAHDHGGSLYTIPSETFEPNLGRGMSEKEWKSSLSVKPESKEDFPSALEAMISHDVQVFFVTKEQFAAMRASDDQGRALLRTLVSENGRRGTNIKEF